MGTVRGGIKVYYYYMSMGWRHGEGRVVRWTDGVTPRRIELGCERERERDGCLLLFFLSFTSRGER